jgi:hypothetical protein
MGEPDSDAYAINDSGQMIGVRGELALPLKALFWANSSTPPVQLPLPAEFAASYGRGINSSGQMSGTGYNEDFTVYRVLVWENSTSMPAVLSGLPAPLDNAAGATANRDLSDSGQLVGAAFETPAKGLHAVSWANSSSPAVALGTVNGLPFSYAVGLNNSGQIIGYSFNAARDLYTACFWPNSASPAIELRGLGGELSSSLARGINAHGRIIGYARNPGQTLQRGVLWANSTSPALDLNSVIPSGSGWVLDYPESINDKGVIVGSGAIGGHIQRAFALIPRVQFLSAVSRKTHGTGTFDIPLPLDGPRGVECRSSGASGNHQVVVKFAAPVTFTSAAVSSGSGSIANATMSGTELTVSLSGVGNAQNITITLSNVTDRTDTADLAIPMSILLGDVNGDRTVNSGDALLTRSRSGQQMDATKFRSDVNADGAINSGDAGIVRKQSGTYAP